MTKEAEARKGRAGHSVAITAEKIEKVVHFGASLLLGPRLRHALACEPQATHARFSARPCAGFPRLDASKKSKK